MIETPDGPADVVARPRRRRAAVALVLLVGAGLAAAMQFGAWRDRQVDEVITFVPNDRVHLEGHPRVLVGDSMCVRWPGDDHDALAFSMMPSNMIRQFGEKYLRAGKHREVVFWIGTAHLHHGFPPEVMRADMPAFVAAAGDRPYVILGPLCPREATPAMRATFAAMNVYLAATYPDAYLDPATILGIPGPGDAYYTDGIHISPEGYAVLQPAVDAALARQAREQS